MPESLKSNDRTALRLLVDEAAALYLRLQDEPENPALRRESEVWRAQGAAHEQAWRIALRTWTLTGVALQPSGAKVVAFPRRKTVALLVGGLAAACAAVWLAAPLSVRLQSDYRAPASARQAVALEDGTAITLDKGASIAVAWHEDRREVRLLAGRAWFDVAKDRERPFIVSAGAARVEVTGTAFDVGLEEGAVDVALATGAVRLSGEKGKAVDLVPGDRVRVEDRGGRMVRGRMSVAAMGSWRRDQLILEDAPLSEGISRLRPYYSGVIIVRSPSVAQSHVTGVYSLKDPEAALKLMVYQQGARVHRVTPWVLVVADK